MWAMGELCFPNPTSDELSISFRLVLLERREKPMNVLIFLLLGLFTLSHAEILSYTNHEIDSVSPEYLKIPKYGSRRIIAITNSH
jgi:hypothetical protein